MSPLEDPRFSVFVYGSLKRGERNHRRYCRGYIAAEAATVRARMYRQPAGYPMIVVPPADILLLGTGDYLADAKLEQTFSPPVDLPSDAAARTAAPDEEGLHWRQVHGEVLTFNDPAARLPRLDRLEDFRPGEAGSLYQRAVIPVFLTGSDQPLYAWSYVAPGGHLPGGCTEMGSSWP